MRRIEGVNPQQKSKLQYNDINDFLLGFEYGRIPDGMWYYRDLVNKRPGRAAGEESQHVANENQLSDIRLFRQAILKGNLSFSSCANVFTEMVVTICGLI